MTAPWDQYGEARTILDYLVAACVLVLMPAISAAKRGELAQLGGGSLVPLYVAAIVRGLAVAAAIAAVWLIEQRSFTALGLGWPNAAGWIAMAAVGALAIAACVQLALIGTLDDARLKQAEESIAAQKILPRDTREYTVFAGLSVSAGLWEEIAYRGFLIWFLAAWLGGIGAAVAAALAFGAGHAYQGLGGVIRTTALGLIFGAAYLLCESLWPLIVAHIGIDLFGGSVARRIQTVARARKTAAAS